MPDRASITYAGLRYTEGEPLEIEDWADLEIRLDLSLALPESEDANSELFTAWVTTGVIPDALEKLIWDKLGDELNRRLEDEQRYPTDPRQWTGGDLYAEKMLEAERGD